MISSNCTFHLFKKEIQHVGNIYVLILRQIYRHFQVVFKKPSSKSFVFSLPDLLFVMLIAEEIFECAYYTLNAVKILLNVRVLGFSFW